MEGMMKRQLAYQIGYVIAAVAFGAPASAGGIATVTDVVNEGYRTPPGHEEQAAKRADELVQNEALRTDDESSIAVTFVDGSELKVEAESEMVLSDYVFDGAASKGLINLNDGLFHFTSNGKPDQGVKLQTPVATIGVRGTEFLVHVDGRDVTIIDILSGAVEAKPNGTGKPVVCVGGQSILIAGPNEDARCGDLGSFSAAAGSPSRDRNRPEPGHGGQNHDRPKPDKPNKPDKPDPDPDPDGGEDGNEGGGSGNSMLFDEEPFTFG
jgi:hypothetical protein